MNEKQTKTTSSEDDHNYLAPEIDTNIIYIIEPEITSNDIQQMDTFGSSSNVSKMKPTILVCNSNFGDSTIMDVGAIQTVDHDAQAIIS